MNTEFSLSRTNEQNFPDKIRSADGKFYRIRADARTILTIFRLLTDNSVMAQHKPLLIQRLFFITETPTDGFQLLLDFLGFTGETQNEPQFDYEYDATEIYADFLRYYGIDLMNDSIHYKRFVILLANLPSDSALKKKIELRFADTSKLKGKEREKMEAEKAKVQLPVYLTREEEKEQAEFIKEWGSV